MNASTTIQLACDAPDVDDPLGVTLLDTGGMPQIVSVGGQIPGYVPALSQLPVAHAGLDEAVPLGVIAEHATGFPGRPGLIGARADGTAWSPRFASTSVESSASSATFELVDTVAELGLTLRFELSDVLTISATLTNLGTSPYSVQRLSCSIPMPAHADELLSFEGRWCREFQPRRSPFQGTTAVENRSGRTSHASMPALFAGPTGFGEQHGEVWGVQLAWSGNHELSAQALPDGRRHLQCGELLDPGEVRLAPGESYRAPDVVVAWSPSGLTQASQAFHREVRRRLPSSGPRPVILNTWEAVYFDHRHDTLSSLADAAAEVGVERFVLDDGWFGGRRNDRAGLGDWWVSEAVWPDGLGPIIDHVRSLDMEFGLWVEPEMVNPDSELYRAHPEWTLTTQSYEPVLARHQLVLDLGRAEVREYLFEALAALLETYDIAYFKWDMNRDIVQGSSGGRPGTHGHVAGVYELIDRLRATFPDVQIESCASGGGRADLGILRRTDRIWTSDCNDALERQLIQRGFSMLFPPEVMGAHIGPDRAHTTRRRQDLAFRSATALFGHLGIEWNLLAISADERAEVAAAVALHKRLRPLLHSGRTHRVDHPDPNSLVHGVVANDRSHAVFAYAQLQPTQATVTAPVRLVDLESESTYRVTIIDDLGLPTEMSRRSPPWFPGPINASGAQLMRTGLRLPVIHAEQALLIELRREDGTARTEPQRSSELRQSGT